MKKQKTSKVKIGQGYKTSYGDIRIPIIVRDRSYRIEGIDFSGFEVVYIEKQNDTLPFTYNPYRNCVGETTFLKSTPVEAVVLTQEQVSALENVLYEADERWQMLFRDFAIEISKIYKYED